MDATEYQAKREWLRLDPHGMRAQAVRRELRAYERELQARCETVERPTRASIVGTCTTSPAARATASTTVQENHSW